MEQDSRLTELVSVVICARDREKLIEQTLRSVALNRPGEIVVIDDCSRDRTAEVARRFTDKVVRSAGNGLAAARQRGAQTAHCKYVMYVDSDVVLTEGCLAALVSVLESDATIGGTQAMIEAPGATSYWARCEQARRTLSTVRTVGDRQTMACSATMYRRELILQYRFDPFFVGAGEDIDFSRRLKSAGWRLYRTNAIAYHHSRDSLIEFVNQRFWYGRGAMRLAMRTLPPNQDAQPSKLEPLAPHKHRAAWSAQLNMLPFFLISGSAYHLGWACEWIAQIGKRNRP